MFPEKIKEYLNRIYLKFRPLFSGFNYTKEWYENDYNFNIYQLDKYSYDEIMKIWEEKGAKRRLFDVLDRVQIPPKANWL